MTLSDIEHFVFWFLGLGVLVVVLIEVWLKVFNQLLLLFLIKRDFVKWICEKKGYRFKEAGK